MGERPNKVGARKGQAVTIKEALLREFGDHGADTFRRYIAQMEYTAYWCIRMLIEVEGILAIIPEAIEDLVIVRRDFHELHQIKTRNESQGPWTFGEVLPILCQQYNRRGIYSNCQFHFVSNQIADKREQRNYGGSLYYLKLLLEIKHSGQNYNTEEQRKMNDFENILCPLIQDIMLKNHEDEIELDAVINLLHNTYIDTECNMVGNARNIEQMGYVLEEIYLGQPSYTLPQLNDICQNLLFVIIKKIIDTSTINERRIHHDDVLNCRGTIVNIPNAHYLDLNKLPGKTILDKKMLHGGFDTTELPRFHRQKASAEYFRRSYSGIGMSEEIDQLIDDLLECQGECRDIICRLDGISKNPGPRILAMLKPKLETITKTKSFPGQELTNLLCLGLLWSETQNCNVYWHELESSA